MKVLLWEFRSKLNDNKTIKDFKNNNNLNIEEIIETYNNYLYTIINKVISSQEDIEEILSDIFIVLWNNYNNNKINDNDKIKPYLVGITKNLIKKKYRDYNMQHFIESIDELQMDVPDDYDISKLAENNEKSKIILEIQNNMKDEEQKIFIMFYYQNQKVKDIAKNLNISVAKVKIILYRLRNLIKKKFKERGYNYGN